tara:strand:+ start:1759 stop:2727 length:969 start_codon:yes stop_codon:yes gene_type:complete
MASAPIYCTHKELKRVFPQLDEYDQKTPIYGWVEVTTNKYAAHNSGSVTQLFVDGESLGAAQSAHTDLNVEGEWFYNSTDDVLYYFSASTPSDKLMEAGELFTAMVTQFRTDASRYIDSRLDPKLPKNQLKDKEGNFDYMIVRSTALYAAAFMTRTKDPTSDMAAALMLEADNNIQLLNEGRAALSWQNTGDASQGVLRDVTYTDGQVRPVDFRGRAGSVDYDLVQVKIGTGGAIGTATYNVFVKDSNGLKQNQVVTNEKITGDYQTLAYGLQVRFSGTTDASEATANNEWEVEVRGYNEEVDTADLKGIKMTRRRYYGGRY